MRCGRTTLVLAVQRGTCTGSPLPGSTTRGSGLRGPCRRRQTAAGGCRYGAGGVGGRPGPAYAAPGFDGHVVVSGLTKSFGRFTAVDGVSFVVEPGRVTAFLGPNGAGKTTTLRMLLGLVAPDSGTATISGSRYADLAEPLRAVGAVLESGGAHPGRTGRNHLRIVCDTAGMPLARADEVLDLTGLASAGKRLFRTYSVGMRQRLAIAAAMIGDPRVLILDEPANGLDPDGIRWMREFLRELAAGGRTVLISSHLLAEMEVLADDLVIIAAGTVVAQGTVSRSSTRRRSVSSCTCAPSMPVRRLRRLSIAAARSRWPGMGGSGHRGVGGRGG